MRDSGSRVASSCSTRQARRSGCRPATGPVKHHRLPELSALQVEKRSPADDGVLDAPVPGFDGRRREPRHRDLREEPERYDFRVLVFGGNPVHRAVAFIEARLELGLVRVHDLPIRAVHGKLVSLMEIAHVHLAPENHLREVEVLRLDVLHRPAAQLPETLVHARRIVTAHQAEIRLQVKVPDLGLEQSQGAVEAGIRRHQNRGHPELLGQHAGVKRSGAAEGDQHEVARIHAAVLQRKPELHRHVVVDDLENPGRRLHHVEAQRFGQARPNRRLRPGPVQPEPPAQGAAVPEGAQQQVGVGHRRQLAAPAVTGRSRVGSRAPGPDLHQAVLPDPGDGAAARTQGVDRQHRRRQVLSRDPARGGLLGPPVADHADIGGGAAHVEGDEVPASQDRGQLDAGHHAGRGTREQRLVGIAGADVHAHQAAVGLHEEDLRRHDAGGAQPVHEPQQVGLHGPAHEGIDDGGR